MKDKALKRIDLRLERLEKAIKFLAPSVEDTLRRRGFVCTSHSSIDGIALPEARDEKTLREFYHVMKSYFFRRLLSEVIERRIMSLEECREIESTWGSRAFKKYFEKLQCWGMIRELRRGIEQPSPDSGVKQDCSFTFTSSLVRNFGETLEWFVAQIFQREFATPAIWGARLKNFQKGGDFDVLVRLEWFLGYIECKCSPPYNVRVDEQREILDRIYRLKPDFAIILIDTTLDIKRNILDNLQFLLGRRDKIERILGEVYRTPSEIYIVSSKKNLVRNISTVLKDFLSGRF